MPPHRFAVRLFHPRKPIALSDILPLAENLGLRVLSEVPFLLQAPDRQGVALQVLRVETADKSPVDLGEAGPRFAEALDHLWSGALENDGLNRLVLVPASPGARSRCCVPMPSTCAQTGIPFSHDYMERALVAYPAIARGTVDLFKARFDPALGEAQSAERKTRLEAIETTIAGATGGRGDPRRGPYPAPLSQCRALQPSHQLLARQGVDLLQGRQPRDRRAAGAAAAGRDLRLQPAHGRHPSARRPGGARRHPLVGPARGFPHRDPRADEDADGEERGHRADRLEGRLLSSNARRSAARASRSRPRASPATRP